MDLLSGAATPWTIMGGFVVALGTTIVIGIRALMIGKLVAGNIHDEVRHDRDTYRVAAETALAVNRELASNIAPLITTVDKLVDMTAENQAIMRQLLQLLQKERDPT